MELPPKRTLERLKLSPEVAWYLLSRGYDLPNCPPKFKTPEPRRVKGAYFDPQKVDLVVDVFSRLRHTQGKWAGRPLHLRAWQVAYLIAPTYGWVRDDEDGVARRIIRTQFLDIPRKNAKTTVGGGQAIYLTTADGEPGAQVYALASRKDQARFCFDPVRQLAAQAPDLRDHVKPLRDRIFHPRSGSYFAVMSAVGDAIHGASPHGAFVDEVHIHKSRDLIDAVQTGTGARTQPLVMFATTADDGKPNTIYAELRDRLEKLARGALQDPSFYGVVFGADDDDDPFDEKTWLKANPGLAAGDSPTMEFMRTEAVTAQQSPANLSRFLRLHLGLRTKQETKYLTLPAWDATAGLVDEQALEGRPCHAGLDLASVEDLTAVCYLFYGGFRKDARTRDLVGAVGEYDVLWRFWLPADRLASLDERTAGAASAWVREGHLKLTAGNVIDNEAIVHQIGKDAERFRIRTLGYDRWGATDVVRRLGDQGMECVPVTQTCTSLNSAMVEILRAVLAETLRHGGNPVMRWCVDNLATTYDSNGNVRPDKKNSADKIDGVAALCNAVKECLDAEAEALRLPPASAPSALQDPGAMFRPGGRLAL